jgi:hypothetical protein
MPDFGEYIGNLLAALVSLRVFTLTFDDDERDDDLPFVTQVSDRAIHLEYFIMDRNYKRVRGEWVFCDEVEYPSSFTL